jgi:serine/threonine protein kinase
MAKHKETGRIVAVKIMKRTGITTNQLNNIKNEITVLERVNH